MSAESRQECSGAQNQGGGDGERRAWGGGGRGMMGVNQGDRELPEWGGGGEEGMWVGGEAGS